jgi:alkylhydroperoxidase/carboxymuconolactone decarboxylase family protein YurZ
MQFAVASSHHYKYCSAFHSGAAELNEATEEEVAEAGLLTSTTQGWSSMLHAQQYDYDTSVDEFNQIGAFPQKQQQNAD